MPASRNTQPIFIQHTQASTTGACGGKDNPFDIQSYLIKSWLTSNSRQLFINASIVPESSHGIWSLLWCSRQFLCWWGSPSVNNWHIKESYSTFQHSGTSIQLHLLFTYMSIYRIQSEWKKAAVITLVCWSVCRTPDPAPLKRLVNSINWDLSVC